MRAFLLFLPRLSGHQESNTCTGLALFWITWRHIRVRNRRWKMIKTFKQHLNNSCLKPPSVVYSDKVTFIPRSPRLMLISDETPLISGQPRLAGHLPFPRGWPLNQGSTVVFFFHEGTSRSRSQWTEPPKINVLSWSINNAKNLEEELAVDPHPPTSNR